MTTETPRRRTTVNRDRLKELFCEMMEVAQSPDNDFSNFGK